MGEPTPSGSAKVSDNSLIPSPTHSILSNSRSSDKSHLRRTKTLKRVSFDEKPDIIEEPLETACDTLENTSDKASGSNNLNEEEIKDPPPLEEVRARTPQTRSEMITGFHGKIKLSETPVNKLLLLKNYYSNS